MKILISTTPVEDYLSDMLLHGFRALFGSSVIDYPKKECMYKTYPQDKPVYGRGFTLYRTLDDIPVDRSDIDAKIKHNYFDLIIVPDIQRQHLFYAQYADYLKPHNTVICDGEDNESVFPYKGRFFKRYWNVKKPHKTLLYFKREWSPKTIQSLYFKLIPSYFCNYLPAPKTLQTISFAIPEEKISNLPEKSKQFPDHIVDNEIANMLGKTTRYAFTNESDYYHDLQMSRFGITVKRAGWDCMRHYEIAANGAVICFKNLDDKPASCAPHDLNRNNCITYTNSGDLMRTLEQLTDDQYEFLQHNSMRWIRSKTTKLLAHEVLDKFRISQR